MENKKENIVILGSGIASLSALDYAKSLGLQASCYTMDSVKNIGGLCSSFVVQDNFRFDNAVHLSFAKEQEVRDLFDKTPFYKHPPISYNFDRKFWIKHPVQNHLYGLPVEERLEIIKSFITKNDKQEVCNYEDWLISQYGYEFANRYPIKYTNKYWTLDPKQLGIKWISNRMNKVALEDVLRGAMADSQENYYYTQEMRYPKHGGYQAFIQPMINDNQKNIHLDHIVTAIDIKNKKIEFTNGSFVYYEHLVTSIPLPELINSIKVCNQSLKDLADNLIFTSVDLISVGFSRPTTNKLWFYIYDDDIFASRVYSPHIKSPDNVPTGCSSLQFEIYSSQLKPQTRSTDELYKNVIFALKKMGIATAEDILFMHRKTLKYGNVVFDLGMEERRDQLIKYIMDYDIFPIGRFGLWDYLWSNQAFMSGIKAIDNIINKQKQ
jgi:protoporphyrinogen oxidase